MRTTLLIPRQSPAAANARIILLVRSLADSSFIRSVSIVRIRISVLVGIPLPGTGAWTGALVAALLDIRMRHALPAILLGLIIAGIITTAVTVGLVSLF